MKRIIFIMMLGSCLTLSAQSGSYHTAIGLRAGETSGLTVKQFIGGSSALEGIVGFWYNGLSLTLLYEKYVPAGVNGLNWYFGGGGHVAFGNGYYWHDNRNRYYYYRDGHTGFGVDGVIGIEYKIPPAPIAISVDLKPFLEITDYGDVWGSLDPSIGIKIAF